MWLPYAAEGFQVANYGLGGQYSTHLDPHGHWEGRSSHPMHSLSGCLYFLLFFLGLKGMAHPHLTLMVR